MAAPVISTGDIPPASTWNTWFVNILFARKTADESLASSTTLQDDDHLFVSVEASATYHAVIECHDLAQPAVGMKIGFTGPAGYSFVGNANGPSTGTTSLQDRYGLEIVSGTPLSFGGVASNNIPISIQGLVITSGTAGTFRLQWAQSTSNASGTTMKAGSFMLLRRVA